MKLTIVGPPGVGKGTISEVLSEELNLEHLSVGNLLKKHMRQNSSLGKKFRKMLKRGDLLPDEIVDEEVLKEIKGKRNYLLDGYPRTVHQAEWLGKRVDKVLYLDAPDEELVKRISSRRVCPRCGESYNAVSKKPKKKGYCDEDGEKLVRRKDDEPRTVRHRLKIYKELSKPVLDYYKKQGILKKINANKSIPQVINSARKAVQ